MKSDIEPGFRFNWNNMKQNLTLEVECTFNGYEFYFDQKTVKKADGLVEKLSAIGFRDKYGTRLFKTSNHDDFDAALSKIQADLVAVTE